jgi:hypothetical protein
MPITPFLNGRKFDAETRRVLGVAFEIVCVALRTGDCDDDVKQCIASQIIELASDGERNPDVLCERALKLIRGERIVERAQPPMAKVPINDPQHWRKRAEGARTLADQMQDPDARRRAHQCLEIEKNIPPREMVSALSCELMCGTQGLKK